MEKILIIASYPYQNQEEGANQRILAIDKELENVKRTYLRVKFKRFNRIHKQFQENNIEFYQLNLFLHLFEILRIIASHKYVYVHSLCNYLFLYPVRFMFKHKSITFDVHGSVPEETEFRGLSLAAKIYNFIEPDIFKKAKNIICVSKEMKNFYCQKYPFCANANFLIKPIYPTNVFQTVDNTETSNLKQQLGISDTDTVFIYSGNIQKWQNVDLAIDTALKIARPGYFFIFLTGATKAMSEMIESKGKNSNLRYYVDCVKPSELAKFYTISHYGFILRDEHILNRVAAPTKLIEYMYFGITPIVKTEIIGDAYAEGYEYLSYEKLSKELHPRKSLKNVGIANSMANLNNNVMVSDLIFSK